MKHHTHNAQVYYEAECELYLHVTIQQFIQLADLLSQLLQIVGLVHDVGIHLDDTNVIDIKAATKSCMNMNNAAL